MIYFAHRGFSSRRVQNTTEAFALARQERVTCYELDVHLLKDGQLAVHHDYSFRSVTDQEVRLADLTAADLKKYPLKNPFSSANAYIPLLDEILPLVEPGLKLLNIEIKNDNNVYPGLENALLTKVQSWPQILPKILFSSFDYEALERLRALNKNARIGLLTRNFDVSKPLALRAESVHINQIRLTEEMVSICHQNNLKVYVYTVNTVRDKQRVEKLGVDGIFTDCLFE